MVIEDINTAENSPKMTDDSHTDSSKLLSKSESYNLVIDYTTTQCVEMYIHLFIRYIDGWKSICPTIPETVRSYMFSQGVNIVSNVFSLVLLNTKNLNISSLVTDRAFQYYCAFVYQMTQEMSENITLSTRDAIQFVYRKSIYCLQQSPEAVSNVCEREGFNHIILSRMRNIVHAILKHPDAIEKPDALCKHLLLLMKSLTHMICNIEFPNTLEILTSNLVSFIDLLVQQNDNDMTDDKCGLEQKLDVLDKIIHFYTKKAKNVEQLESLLLKHKKLLYNDSCNLKLILSQGTSKEAVNYLFKTKSITN